MKNVILTKDVIIDEQNLVKDSVYPFTRWYKENACAYVKGIGEVYFKPEEFIIITEENESE